MPKLLLPLAISALLAMPAATYAADVRAPHITVSGEGHAALAPDMAILTMTVMRQSETARAALDADNTAMQNVIDAMKEGGVAAKDLQTAGLSIQPQLVYPKDASGNQQVKIVGYQVSNTLTARVRDLKKLGSLIDQSVTLGVNQGGSITFTNDDPSAALDEARRKAVADAIAKAHTLTDAAGIKLGPIIEIAEQSGNRQPVPFEAKSRMAVAAVPVETGENTYNVGVTITFGIGQ